MTIRRVVSDRRGGHSAAPYDSFNLGTHVGDQDADVRANRARLAGELKVDSADLVWMEQVHGRTVTVVNDRQAGPVPMTDALVTTTPGLVLAVLVADCVPVLLWDSQAGVAAAMHAGRRGVRLGIAAEVVRVMAELGATQINALLGPAICGECYEVPAQMQSDVETYAPGSASTTTLGTPGLDLRAGLVGQLQAAGVAAVASDPRCTATDPALFSYRRDGGVTGRQAGLVWIS